MLWSFQYFRVFKVGDYQKLLFIPEGFSIYNVELYLGLGGQLGLSAGTSIKIINRYSNKYNKMLLKLRSGDEYFINSNCGATIGVCSNSDHWLRNLKKAGTRRLFGFRSKVRGVAMNPIDHPHGGNTAGGHPCMTPKGLLTKGVKTRKNPISNKLIFKRRIRRIDYIVKAKVYK
jgi:large subunit ribosomal protein L2